MGLTTEVGRGQPQEFPSLMPCLPTATAFHRLMSNTLRDAHWQTAGLVALWCASSYKEAAQDGLRAALAGARKQDSASKADVPVGLAYEKVLNTLEGSWYDIEGAETTTSVSFPTSKGSRRCRVPWCNAITFGCRRIS